MKTIFVINPKAGQGDKVDGIVGAVKKAISETESDAEIYITKALGDAQIFVENYCRNNGPARFIACGGDGTLSEVLGGAIACKGAQVGVVPMGTGNDFCKNFGGEYNFHDIEGQLFGNAFSCDAIRYSTEFDGNVKQGYCINMFNIGFDCKVADMTADIKKKPFISGSLAYFVSILIALVKKECYEMSVEVDGEEKHCGKLLLTSVANGSYCGGGIKSNPLALVTDGKINFNIIKNISRCRFISLLPHYMKGTILNVKGIEKYILSDDCEKMKVKPLGGHMRLCVDGEITDAGETVFEICHNAFEFVLPDRKGKEFKKTVEVNELLV